MLKNRKNLVSVSSLEKKFSNNRPKVFRKKFAEFAGRHLSWSLFLTYFTEKIQKQSF